MKCPTCGSPDPSIHAVDGTYTCPDPFHPPQAWNKPGIFDPEPWLAVDGCRFRQPQVRDGNFEHAFLEFAPRKRMGLMFTTPEDWENWDGEWPMPDGFDPRRQCALHHSPEPCPTCQSYIAAGL